MVDLPGWVRQPGLSLRLPPPPAAQTDSGAASFGGHSRGKTPRCALAVYKAKFPLVGDPTHALTNAFGVHIPEEGLALRGTLVGKI